MRKFTTNILCVAGTIILASSINGTANAASYNFSVDYFGNNNATLATGSDNPLAQTLFAGDNFTYSLTGKNGVFFTTTGGQIFPFVALALNEAGQRISDFSLTLLYNGNSVFAASDPAAVNQQVHLGANTINLPANLTFDQIILQDTIVSAMTLDGTASVGSTPTSILPIFGSPDQNQFYPNVVFYTGNTSAVPEGATWGMMITGLGIIGFAMRRRPKLATIRVAYA